MHVQHCTLLQYRQFDMLDISILHISPIKFKQTTLMRLNLEVFAPCTCPLGNILNKILDISRIVRVHTCKND